MPAKPHYGRRRIAPFVLVAAVILIAAGLFAKGRFMIPQFEASEPLRLEADMPAGIRYVLWPARDLFGREVVLAHVAQVSTAATASVDPRFIVGISDGMTPLSEASVLMDSIADGFWSERGIRDTDLLVPGYLHRNSDGSGSFVVHYWQLLPWDRQKMSYNGMDQATVSEEWSSSHIETLTPEDFKDFDY